MIGRDPSSPHRAATPLELLFDLAFVVAFAVPGIEVFKILAVVFNGGNGPFRTGKTATPANRRNRRDAIENCRRSCGECAEDGCKQHARCGDQRFADETAKPDRQRPGGRILQDRACACRCRDAADAGRPAQARMRKTDAARKADTERQDRHDKPHGGKAEHLHGEIGNDRAGIAHQVRNGVSGGVIEARVFDGPGCKSRDIGDRGRNDNTGDRIARHRTEPGGKPVDQRFITVERSRVDERRIVDGARHTHELELAP